MTNIKFSTILKGLENDGIDVSELKTYNTNTREGISDIYWFRETHNPQYSTWWGILDEYCIRRLNKFQEIEA